MVAKINSIGGEPEGFREPEAERTVKEPVRQDPVASLNTANWVPITSLIGLSSHGIKELSSPLSD